MGLRTVHMDLVFTFGGNDRGSASNSLGGGGNSDNLGVSGTYLERPDGSVTGGKTACSGSMPKA